MPNSLGNERLALLAPVLSHPWMAEPSEQSAMVKSGIMPRGGAIYGWLVGRGNAFLGLSALGWSCSLPGIILQGAAKEDVLFVDEIVFPAEG